MIKKIRVSQLDIGMYIHDLTCGWMQHPFIRNRFLVDDADTLSKIGKLGVTHVYIDTFRGVDVAIAKAPRVNIEEGLCELIAFKPDSTASPPPGDASVRAKVVYANAVKLMSTLMRDVRLGRPIALGPCKLIVSEIIDVMSTSPSALLAITHAKTRDEYTAMHSVSVAVLMVSFGQVLGLTRDEIEDVALGGLLHDVGKAKVPRSILNKFGRLSVEEFHVMKGYVLNTARLLTETEGVSEITLNAAAQHTERYDGTGYPHRLKGEQITLYGQMLAIADFYDAITSVRVYHKGVPPTSALRKLFKLSGSHFNPRLVQAFIKAIGIYPVGSLVRMESEKLGIVRDVAPDKLLQPVVQFIYDCEKMCYIPPETVDISTTDEKIKSVESFEKWGIDKARWLGGRIRKRFRGEPASTG